MGFFDEIYTVVANIPTGKVMTYGQVAKAVGSRDARRVGHVLHGNKAPETVPCHRVVFANGAMAPGYAFGGPEVQAKKLKDEGVMFVGEKVDLDKSGWYNSLKLTER